MSKQNQIIIAIVAAIALGLAVLFGSGSSTQNATNDTNGIGNVSQSEDAASDDADAPVAAAPSDLGPLETPNPLGEIALGDKNAPVTIVEYSSLTCPHCGAFHRDTLPTLKEKYIDKGLVRIHFRPFPFDPYATAGAMLAHCVAPKAQVTFLDILFKRQQQWLQSEQPMDVLQGFAKQGGLSEADFIICLKDQNRLDAIRQIQSTAAEELGVRSTPTFFINGKKLEGNVPLSEFERLLKPALADFEGAQ